MNQFTKTFNHQMLRVIENNNQPWFVAKDVAEILDYSETSQMTRYLDDDETMSVKLTGMNMYSTLISESGLYSAVLRSRKPEAKQFKRWITHDVIPSIRKHGAYMTPEKIEEALMNPDTIIKLATNLKEEQEKRKQAEYQLQIDKPYSTFGKAVSNSTAAINIGAFAKMLYDEHNLQIGRNRLFAWLRQKGYLIKSGRERNQPKQQYVEQGLFDTRVALISRTEGDVESVTTLITGKGQVKIAKELLSEKVMN